MNNKVINVNIALLISRIIVGVIFIVSGWTKVSDMTSTIAMMAQSGIPAFLTYIVAYGELVAGLLLVLGLFTCLSSLFLTIIMIVAVYLTRNYGFQMYSMPLAMLAGLLPIMAMGPGKYAVAKTKE